MFSRRRFFDLTLLWISGLAWYPSCPITFGKIPSSGLQCTLWFIYLHVGHLSAVFTTSHHHLCSTEIYSASLLSSARSVTTSANIERHRHCPQRQGYQISIIGHELERGKRILPVIVTCYRRVLLCTHIYTLPRVLSAGSSFCWRSALSQPACYWARTDHLGSRLHIRHDTVLCTAFGGHNSRR